VVRLVWSNDPESYAGSSVATSRASRVGLVKDDDPDKKVYTDRPGWGLWREAKNVTSFKIKSIIMKRSNGCQLGNSAARLWKSYKEYDFLLLRMYSV
jgi:hypothetical protein